MNRGIPPWHLAIVVGVLVLAIAAGVMSTGRASTPEPRYANGAGEGSGTGPAFSGGSVPSEAVRAALAGGPLQVLQTIVLSNDTVIPGNFLAGNGNEPTGVTYVPSSGEIVVSNQYSNNLSLLNDSSGKLVGTIPVADPGCSVYVPWLNRLFVVNENRGVTAISMTNDSIVGAVTLFGGGSDGNRILYDNLSGNLYVSNFQQPGVVDAVNASNLSLVASIPVGNFPAGLALENRTGELFIADQSSQNLTVIATGNNTVIGAIGGFNDPTGLAYDTTDQRLFVGNLGSNYLSVVNATTGAIVRNVTAGTGPEDLLYVASLGIVYVSVANATEPGGSPQTPGSLVAIDAVTTTVTRTVPVGDDPHGLAYDSGHASVWVANRMSNSVTIVSAATGTLPKTTVVGSYPLAVAYDARSNELFELSYDESTGVRSNIVAVLNATTGGHVGNFSVGWGPQCLAVDAGTNQLFVGIGGAATGYGGGVDAVNLSTDKVVAFASTGAGSWPSALAYDSVDGAVYVADTGTDTVGVVNDTYDTLTTTVTVGGSPSALAFDAATGHLFVTNLGSNTVSVINASTDSIVKTLALPSQYFPYGAAIDPARAQLWVVGWDQSWQNATVLSTTNYSVLDRVPYLPGYGVVFDPALGDMVVAQLNGSVVVANDSNRSIVERVAVGQDPLGIALGAGLGEVFTANQIQGTISVLGAGSNTSGSTSVEFRETGLPNGMNWTVTVSGASPQSTNGSALGFTLPRGVDYSFVVSGPANFTVTPSKGMFAAAGPTVSISVRFVPAPAYLVAFTEWGLPSGSNWTVDLDGTSRSAVAGSEVRFTEPNGSHAWSVSAAGSNFAPNVSHGAVLVAGASDTLSVGFHRFLNTTYGVTFRETGLTAGTNWSVSVNGSSQSTSMANVTFVETNGSYGYVVGNVTGYQANPGYGSLQVAGLAENLTINFSVVVPTAPLRLVSFVADPSTIGLRLVTTIRVTTSGGTGPLSYAYAGLPPGCVTVDAPTFACRPTEAGEYSLSVVVSDLSGERATGLLGLRVTSTGPVASAGPLAPPYAVAILGLAVAVPAVALIAVRWRRARPRKGPEHSGFGR